MLKVKTSIGPSKTSGIGLFADVAIAKGQIVWSFNPQVDIVYLPEEWSNLERELDSSSFEAIKRYAYKENNRYILCTDNAQFMNHCHENQNVCNSEDLQTMYATRDIEMGEELLCNYFDYSDHDDHHAKFLNQLFSASQT